MAPFYIRDGKERHKGEKKTTYTDVFSQTILEEARENRKLTAISAAMPLGTGLTAFSKEFPSRFFDVGIAEEHAVTFAAGMAAGGLHPVVAIYSTFLQRAYDQMIHDVCIDSLPVTFAVDRAGLVGSDGETHQGIFDLAYLMQMPNLTVMAPKNVWELREMLRFAFAQQAPVAIRYPRGKAYEGLQEHQEPIVEGKSEWIVKESQIALLAVGSMVETAVQVRERLKEQGYHVSIVNVRFVKPIDDTMLEETAKEHVLVVPMEEGIKNGGFGEAVAAWHQGTEHLKVCPIALPDQFIEHGSVELLKKKYQLDVEGITERIIEEVSDERA